MANNILLKLVGYPITIHLSLHEETLLFIHAPFLSGQWPIDKIGIQVTHERASVKIGITSTDNAMLYQSWIVEAGQFDEIVSYFKGLGFPVPNPDPMGYAKRRALIH